MDRHVNLFNIEDYNSDEHDPMRCTKFRIYYIPQTRSTSGGRDEHNDCLINCIKNVIQSKKKEIEAAELKKRFRSKS